MDSISKPMPAVREPNVSTVPSAPPTHKVRLPKLTIKGGGPRKKNSGLRLKNFLQQPMENYTQLCSSIASQHIPKMTAEGSF